MVKLFLVFSVIMTSSLNVGESSVTIFAGFTPKITQKGVKKKKHSINIQY